MSAATKYRVTAAGDGRIAQRDPSAPLLPNGKRAQVERHEGDLVEVGEEMAEQLLAAGWIEQADEKKKAPKKGGAK